MIRRRVCKAVLLFAIIALAIHCKNPETVFTPILQPSQFIPVDINDSLYGDFRSDFKETFTADGWKISYLVKDDSTKYEDIYIKWEKGESARTLNFPTVLLMRSYFLPVFKTETKTHLFFEHGCATGCSAVTALPKNPKAEPHVFNHIVDYDVKTGRIAFIPERSFSLDVLELDVFDLNMNTNKTVIFKNRCNLSPEDGCIEKVVFSSNTVEFSGTFKDAYGTAVKEKQTVVF